MLSAKNVWTFGVIVITFVFLPPENWDYWFFGGKADRYGEFCFRNDKHLYVVAKNLLPSPVHLGFSSVKSAWTSRIGAPEMEELVAGSALPPNSYSLLEVTPGSFVEPITHKLEPEYSFNPKPLILITPIEEDRWSFFILALILAAAGLSYSVGSFMREDARQKERTKVDYSWPTQ